MEAIVFPLGKEDDWQITTCPDFIILRTPNLKHLTKKGRWLLPAFVFLILVRKLKGKKKLVEGKILHAILSQFFFSALILDLPTDFSPKGFFFFN